MNPTMRPTIILRPVGLYTQSPHFSGTVLPRAQHRLRADRPRFHPRHRARSRGIWVNSISLGKLTQSFRYGFSGGSLYRPAKYVPSDHKAKLLRFHLRYFGKEQDLALELTDLKHLVVSETRVETRGLKSILNAVLSLKHPLDSRDGLSRIYSRHVAADLAELAAEVPCRSG